MDSTQWEKVELRNMETKKPPRKFKMCGEGIINIHVGVKSTVDLNAGEIEEIKKRAAKYGGCVVFVDFKDFYGTDMRKKNKLYFYFGYFK